jgi:hypothetical protein
METAPQSLQDVANLLVGLPLWAQVVLGLVYVLCARPRQPARPEAPASASEGVWGWELGEGAWERGSARCAGRRWR